MNTFSEGRMSDVVETIFLLVLVLFMLPILTYRCLCPDQRSKIKFVKTPEFYRKQYTNHKSRGIVFAAGGKYLPLAIQNVRILRHLNCNLPITIVYADNAEISSTFPNVRLINATDHFKQFFPTLPVPNFRGFQLKPFAVLFSGYKEVILLDADTISFQNPEYLFETKEFKETGAIFFPDVVDNRVSKWLKPEFWSQYLQIPEPKFIWQQDSSCIVMDLSKQLESLLYTCDLNYQYKVTYKFVHGDKDTWRASSELANLDYTFISDRPGMLVSNKSKKNFVQYDMNGNILYAQGKDIRLGLKYHGFIEHPRHRINIWGNTYVELKKEQVVPLPENVREILKFMEKYMN